MAVGPRRRRVLQTLDTRARYTWGVLRTEPMGRYAITHIPVFLEGVFTPHGASSAVSHMRATYEIYYLFDPFSTAMPFLLTNARR